MRDPNVIDFFVAFYQNALKALVLGVLPALLAAVAVFACMQAFFRKFEYPVIATAFATLGTVCGMLVGGSRSAAVSAFLPLVLPMIALFVTFIVERKDDAQLRTIYMVSLTVFFLGIIFGAYYGASLRGGTSGSPGKILPGLQLGAAGTVEQSAAAAFTSRSNPSSAGPRAARPSPSPSCG